MRFLVVSDIHGRYERLAKLLDMQKGIDALIFLGDGLSDLDRADAYDRGISVICVKGNCDGFRFSAGTTLPRRVLFALRDIVSLCFTDILAESSTA